MEYTKDRAVHRSVCASAPNLDPAIRLNSAIREAMFTRDEKYIKYSLPYKKTVGIKVLKNILIQQTKNFGPLNK